MTPASTTHPHGIRFGSIMQTGSRVLAEVVDVGLAQDTTDADIVLGRELVAVRLMLPSVVAMRTRCRRLHQHTTGQRAAAEMNACAATSY